MKKIVVVAFLYMLPGIGFGQVKDTLIRKLDSLSIKADSAGKQINNTSADAYNQETQLTFKSYFQLLGSNLKQDFTKPFHMKKRDWARFVV